jgi:methyltransferase (TIGR00027 family)
MRIENVSGTAFVVAEFRAEENGEAAPLYHDPVVGFFLNEDTKRAADRVATDFPPVKDMVRIRTRFFDDVLDTQVRAGVRQIVILGAGLDTRAVRKPAAGVRYFEIDDAATVEWKRRCYQQNGIDVDMSLIPGNYVTDGMIEMLRMHGFNFDLPTYLIWEGNTMYLPLACTRQVLAELKKHVKDFRISFDYLTEAVITKTTGDAGVTTLVESFAAMGAPWLSGIRDIGGLASEFGLQLIENYKTAELCASHWRHRQVTSPIFTHYSVCTLGTGAVAA